MKYGWEESYSFFEIKLRGEIKKYQFKQKRSSAESPKQASVARLELKQQKNEYATRCKEATNLVANGNLEPVDNMIVTVNAKYIINGKQKIAKSTVYRAVKKGLAGQCPPKKARHLRFPPFY